MLKSYLVTQPFTKFVVIEDNLEQRGKPLLDFILKQHIQWNNRIHYFIFQENINKFKRTIDGKNGIMVHDFTSNPLNWNKERAYEDLESAIRKLLPTDVVFVDSLANVIYQNGLADTYKLFNSLRHHVSLKQVVTLLHTDMLENDTQVSNLFGHLCSLMVTLLPGIDPKRGRVQYLYKKLGGRIIKELEEYYFDDDIFHTEAIKKIDPKTLLEDLKSTEVNPETLTTFRIGLTAKERESRDQLVLPYLPKTDDGHTEGRIVYDFDEGDDWDEEDPDDDLDI